MGVHSMYENYIEATRRNKISVRLINKIFSQYLEIPEVEKEIIYRLIEHYTSFVELFQNDNCIGHKYLPVLSDIIEECPKRNCTKICQTVIDFFYLKYSILGNVSHEYINNESLKTILFLQLTRENSLNV